MAFEAGASWAFGRSVSQSHTSKWWSLFNQGSKYALSSRSVPLALSLSVSLSLSRLSELHCCAHGTDTMIVTMAEEGGLYYLFSYPL